MTRVVVCSNVDVEPELGHLDRDLWDVWSQVTPAACSALRERGADVEIVELRGDDLFHLAAGLVERPPDVVLNLCESLNEDSRNEMALPCLLDVLGVPYTGSSALALGLALHKDKAKAILRARGVPTPNYAVVNVLEDIGGDAVATLGFPLIVKPAHEDGSLGIGFDSVVEDASTLAAATRRVLDTFGPPAVIESYIDGRELSVPILGNRPRRALPVLETDFGPAFAGRPRIITYEAKWDERAPEYTEWRPSDLDETTRQRVVATALEAFAALGCRDYGRVDVRLTPDGEPFVIEVNPNCDLHPQSELALSAAAAGILYPELLELIVAMAIEAGR